MHPAPSVILFTVLSGLGFGFLAALGAGVLQPAGWAAFLLWGLGYGLSVAGLLASTFHLGRPERAWRALSQWRSSWLSREGLCALASLVLLAPMALSDGLGLGLSRGIGQLGAVLAVRWLLRRAPKRYGYYLWAVVGFRLACPVRRSSASLRLAKP